VKLHSLTGLLNDLIQVLPTRTAPEWSEVEHIPANTPVIILVSGFGATRRNLSVMRKRFQKDGYHVIVLALDWHTISDSVRGFYRMSEQLSTMVLKLRKVAEARNSRVIVVAHSAGGLIARHYIQLLGGFHYCDGLITLATPHRGTWVAGLGLMTHLILKARCLLQMLPFSSFIRKINKAAFPSNFKMVSIYSTDDLICPARSTQLPVEFWNQEDIETIEVTSLSHGDFLLSKKIYQMVRSYLPTPLSTLQKVKNERIEISE
jgi:alpha-beta hydrolase superfamily lysophospholipase